MLWKMEKYQKLTWKQTSRCASNESSRAAPKLLGQKNVNQVMTQYLKEDASKKQSKEVKAKRRKPFSLKTTS